MDKGEEQASILIVDDSPESIDLLVGTLPETYRCRFALSGDKALEMLSDPLADPPDLILLDVVMPGMDGFELCDRIKHLPRFEEIPVIFLSARSDVDFKIRAFECGAADYVEKPFHAAEVRARVRTHVRLHQTQLECERHTRHLEKLVRERTARILESQNETIYALIRLLNERDPLSGHRIEAFQRACYILAGGLRRNPRYADLIDDEYVDLIFRACVLNDIGKVAVPDRILQSPAPLAADDAQLLRTHTTIGATTLREVMERHPGNAFIEMGVDIAFCHHERWDGTGYPRGIAGDRIPLSAQIVAVVDDYDSLIAKRPYKESFDRNDALGVVMSGSGSLYNPAIVEAFIVCEPQIFQAYKDLR